MKEDRYKDKFNDKLLNSKKGSIKIKYNIINTNDNNSIKNIVLNLCSSFGLYYYIEDNFSITNQIEKLVIEFPNNFFRLGIINHGGEKYSVYLHKLITRDYFDQLESYSYISFNELKEKLLMLIINNICN